jgi:hypothetical protein
LHLRQAPVGGIRLERADGHIGVSLARSPHFVDAAVRRNHFRDASKSVVLACGYSVRGFSTVADMRIAPCWVPGLKHTAQTIISCTRVDRALRIGN